MTIAKGTKAAKNLRKRTTKKLRKRAATPIAYRREYASPYEERRLWETCAANASIRLPASKVIKLADDVLAAYRIRFTKNGSVT